MYKWFFECDLACEYNRLSALPVVCYTAVFSVVTQRSSPRTEERCVTTLKIAV